MQVGTTGTVKPILSSISWSAVVTTRASDDEFSDEVADEQGEDDVDDRWVERHRRSWRAIAMSRECVQVLEARLCRLERGGEFFE